MKYYFLLQGLLIAHISLLSQKTGSSNIQLPPDIFSIRYISIGGEFWAQLPAFEKKEDSSDSISFKAKEGLFQIRINGVITKDKPDQVVISLLAFVIPGYEPGFTIFINKKPVIYETEGRGFGTYSGKEYLNNEYKIITRIKLTSPAHPDYYLEFPVIVQITPSGNIDNTYCFIPEEAGYFRLYQVAGK